MLDAMRDMVAQDFLFHTPERGARRSDLRDHINAIAVVLNHTGKAADLTLDPFEAF